MNDIELTAKLKSSYIHNIKKQWKNFIEERPVDTTKLDPAVYASWQRSKDYGVDPYYYSGPIIFSEKDSIEQLITYNTLLESFGNVITVIENIIRTYGLRVQLFDKDCRSISLIDYPQLKHSNLGVVTSIAKNLAEDIVGTNAVCLACLEDRPVMLVGAEHYNAQLHNACCSAAPIHDEQGEVIGVLNIFIEIEDISIDTIGLVSCLADIYDNRSTMLSIMDRLHINEFAMDNIIEYMPQGIMYVSNENGVKHYNAHLLELLRINRNQDTMEQLTQFLPSLDCLNSYENLEHQEILLDIQGRKKSFLLSTRRIYNDHKQEKGKFIIIEDTDKVLKTSINLRGNRAVYTFENILGKNESLLTAKKLAQKVATTSSPVLIFGESGTGKELFAQAIHNDSTRSNNPFVAINCGAIPPDLVESELFGYEAGAFTGALKGGKPGKLELASGGTLFLDEIESMPLNVQIKLLRALSLKEITRVGGIDTIPIHIRIISATKKDLLEESDNGNFREDLYYRISTIVISLPALRDRTDDIPILTHHLIASHVQGDRDPSGIEISADFIDALKRYYWRGNVRELSNVIERAIILLGDDTKLDLCHLPDKIVSAYQFKDLKQKLTSEISDEKHEKDSISLLQTAEEIVIDAVLHREQGNMTKTAQMLRISKPTLYSKINSNPRLKKIKAEFDM